MFRDINIFNTVKDQLLSADSADVMDEIKNLLFKGYMGMTGTIFYLIKFALYAVKCKMLSFLSTVT